jgi:probable phosphomutase (TIGR03848 family)
MPTFLLIRHGENDFVKKGRLAGRLPEVHLNEKGRKQALALAEKLASAPIKAIYSSPLERAIETAEPLAKALGLEIIPRPGLLETDCGEWQGQTVKRLARLKPWKMLHQAPSLFRFPGGESVTECQQRMVREIEALRQLHALDDLVVCVGHSDPLKELVAFYIGLPLDHFQRLSISPASITALCIVEDGSRLLTLNYDISFTVL